MTVITDVAPGRSDQLLGVLDRISADPAGNPVLPLGSFERLHFASLVVFDDDAHGPKLLFEANVDGSAGEWLATLAAEAPEGLEAVYCNCRGFPTSGAPAEVEAYLLRHVVRPRAYRYHLRAAASVLALVPALPLLVRKGARDRGPLEHCAGIRQASTSVWYSAPTRT
jgi:hypothetical protein